MKLALHWQIIIGMVVGVILGFVAVSIPGGKEFVIDWIKPFGTMFINVLKLLAVPLIIASLIMGIANLQDISQLSKMGGRTIVAYLITTVVAVSLGLFLVNVIQPGSLIGEETRDDLVTSFEGEASSRMNVAKLQSEKGPLQPLVDIVPENIFSAAMDNGNMLQVIFFVIFFGIGLMLIKKETARPVIAFFDGFNEVIMKMIDLVMLTAPYGVLALLAALVVESPSVEIFYALAAYSGTVLLGLAILILAFYPVLVKIFTKRNYSGFLKGIGPAQLLAFSTSSSAATLPVTMERVNEHIGVDEEVSSFVLPVGATINMDGTSLYQAVAAVFIAQAFGYDLSIGSQLTIVLTATLASIGSAAVPGAGILMLIIVLEAIGVNPAGIALIFAVDRPLDMCRTVANITGDGAIATLIGKSLGKLKDPKEKKWDDYYHKEDANPEAS